MCKWTRWNWKRFSNQQGLKAAMECRGGGGRRRGGGDDERWLGRMRQRNSNNDEEACVSTDGPGSAHRTPPPPHPPLQGHLSCQRWRRGIYVSFAWCEHPHSWSVSIHTAGMQGNYKDVWQVTMRGMSAEMAVAAQRWRGGQKRHNRLDGGITNSLTAIGAYMHQLFRRDLFKVNNFLNFCPLETFDS